MMEFNYIIGSHDICYTCDGNIEIGLHKNQVDWMGEDWFLKFLCFNLAHEYLHYLIDKVSGDEEATILFDFLDVERDGLLSEMNINEFHHESYTLFETLEYYKNALSDETHGRLFTNIINKNIEKVKRREQIVFNDNAVSIFTDIIVRFNSDSDGDIDPYDIGNKVMDLIESTVMG